MQLLTLLETRQTLWSFANQTTAYASATTQEKADADTRINRVIQRFFEQIRPARTYRRIDVPIYNNQITLPRDTESLLGVKIVNSDNVSFSPLYIYSRFHEFAETDFWWPTSGSPVARPLTELAQTFIDPDAGFYLRSKATAGSGTNYTLFGGTDTTDNELFDSVTLAITNGTNTTTRQWNTLPRIVKDSTTVGVQLYAVDGSGTETLIAIHAPGETTPAYQRYQIPVTSDGDIARVLTRLCYVRLVADTDIVFPSSLGAIQHGLQALQYEEVNDVNNAESAWQKALALIDTGKELLEGEAEIPSLRAQPGFACSGIPNLL